MTVISLAARRTGSASAIYVGGVAYSSPDAAGCLAENSDGVVVARTTNSDGVVTNGVSLLWLDDDEGTRHYFLCDDDKGYYDHIAGGPAEVWEKAVQLALSQGRYFDCASDERIPARERGLRPAGFTG